MTLPDSTPSRGSSTPIAPSDLDHHRVRSGRGSGGRWLGGLPHLPPSRLEHHRVRPRRCTWHQPTQQVDRSRTPHEQPLNILVMGSDTRQGQGSNGEGKGFGMDVTGARSDTTLVVAPASFARPRVGGQHSSRHHRRYSVVQDRHRDVFSNDGSVQLRRSRSVARRALSRPSNRSTDVFIDHFVIVDFNGFQDVVSALGGVDVCLPEAVRRPQEWTRPASGDQPRDWFAQALAYVRARYIGDGSDISRIDRQQAFLSSVVDKGKEQRNPLQPTATRPLPRRCNQIADDRPRIWRA